MTISLCGNTNNLNNFINKMKKIYEDKVIVCDMFNIKFNIVIETESIKYKLLDNCKSLDCARKEYQKVIDERTNDKITKLLNENRDRIVLLIDNNILTNRFTNNCYFLNSDIKILFEGIIDDVNYNKNDFDYVVKDFNDINIRKLVKV